VVLPPEKTFGLIEKKVKTPINRNLIPKKGRKIPGKRGIVLTRLKTFSKPLDFENKAFRVLNQTTHFLLRFVLKQCVLLFGKRLGF